MPRRWVAIQRNPVSGAGRKRRPMLDLIHHLRCHGLNPRVFTNRDRLRQFVERPDRRAQLVCIVAAGGDGTVADVANRFPGVPVAVLPLGTENLLARYLGIPRHGGAVARMIAAGHTRRLDLGVVGERRFVLMASCGFDADVVHRTDARRTGHITKWNYLQPICGSLRNYRYPELTVRSDRGETVLTGRLAVVANLPVYALRLRIARSAKGDDGRLDLRLFQGGSAFQIVRYLIKVAVGRHERLADVTSVQATHIRIESEVPVPIQADGDPAGWTPIEFNVLPAALEIIVPQAPATS